MISSCLSYPILSFHIISYHIISYHIISYHIISYHIISYHIISYHIISYHIISYHIISYHIISYHIISYHINVPKMFFEITGLAMRLIRCYYVVFLLFCCGNYLLLLIFPVVQSISKRARKFPCFSVTHANADDVSVGFQFSQSDSTTSQID